MRLPVALLSLCSLAALAGCDADTIANAPSGGNEGSSTAPLPVSPVGHRVGESAPDWSLRDLDGETRSLSDYRGNVVIMDFWATWCGPCKRAMPGLQKMHEEYADRGLVVLGMNGSERGGDPARYMESQGFTYTTLVNSETVAPQYAVRGIPAMFVIGVDGVIIHHEVGFSTAGEQQIEQAVLDHFAEHGM